MTDLEKVQAVLDDMISIQDLLNGAGAIDLILRHFPELKQGEPEN